MSRITKESSPWLGVTILPILSPESSSSSQSSSTSHHHHRHQVKKIKVRHEISKKSQKIVFCCLRVASSYHIHCHHYLDRHCCEYIRRVDAPNKSGFINQIYSHFHLHHITCQSESSYWSSSNSSICCSSIFSGFELQINQDGHKSNLFSQRQSSTT